MFSIDVSGREPIYVQIEKAIIKFINLGVYEENSPLPSVRSLATELGINPNTVSKAYKDLEQQGVIYTVAGKGVFVNKTELEGVHEKIAVQIKAVAADAKMAGMSKSSVVDIINGVWRGSDD